MIGGGQASGGASSVLRPASTGLDGPRPPPVNPGMNNPGKTLRPLLRITLGVAVGLLLVGAALGMALRQPVLGAIRNPHYHEPTDTAETLDYERMAQVVDGVLAAVLAPGFIGSREE